MAIQLISHLRTHSACDSVEHNLRAIYESDRRSTFSAYEETARICAKALHRAGLSDLEIEPLPADGRTSFGDWVMPLAWDVTDASLGVRNDSGYELLASYRQLPDSLIMQSAPTPPRGIECELVPLETSKPAHWRNRVVFTRQRAQNVKARLAASGALGVVSCYHPFPDEDPQSTFWYNTWSDRPGGWWATAADSKLFGFSLSPNAGSRLAARLSAGEMLRVHCHVDSHFRNGALPFISGRIQGRSDEEVIVTAHLYEHGAHDNASGAACLIETATQLCNAIRSGSQEPPLRSIRFLLMPECYGVLAYATLRRQRIEKTIAGLNLDGVGGGSPIRIVAEPECNNAGLAAAFARIASAEWGPGRIELAPFELCDNLLSDPMIGVPTIWPHSPCRRRSWHTSIDSLNVVDYDFIRQMAKVAGAFLIQTANSVLKRASRDAQARESAAKPSGPGGRVPVRQKIGSLSLDQVPVAEWPSQATDSPRWWSWHTRALWLADGRRSVDEIAALTKVNRSDVCTYFEFLVRWNYIKFA